MPPLVPNRFLVRVAHPCPYVKAMPGKGDAGEPLLALPDAARLDNFARLDGTANFADVRIAWNELGLGVQLTVAGKRKSPEGDAARPWAADGLTLWVDTRDARTAHRASRFCHQFHALPVGGGADNDEPTFAQAKINRATQDAPLCGPADVAFRGFVQKGGYRLDLFLPSAVLTGYDLEQFPRLGVYYHVRDAELGDQYLGVNADFPIADDPSLWEPLDLVKV